MKIKTSELTDAALDWMVAKAVPQKFWPVSIKGKVYLDTDWEVIRYSPSTDWSQLGPLIAKYAIAFWGHDENNWVATFSPEDVAYSGIGPTHLIAACRAIVASVLGDEVDVPEGLL